MILGCVWQNALKKTIPSRWSPFLPSSWVKIMIIIMIRIHKWHHLHHPHRHQHLRHHLLCFCFGTLKPWLPETLIDVKHGRASNQIGSNFDLRLRSKFTLTNSVLVQMQMEVYSAQRSVWGNVGGSLCRRSQRQFVFKLKLKQGFRFKWCFVALRKTLRQDVILPYCDLGSKSFIQRSKCVLKYKWRAKA